MPLQPVDGALAHLPPRSQILLDELIQQPVGEIRGVGGVRRIEKRLDNARLPSRLHREVVLRVFGRLRQGRALRSPAPQTCDCTVQKPVALQNLDLRLDIGECAVIGAFTNGQHLFDIQEFLVKILKLERGPHLVYRSLQKGSHNPECGRNTCDRS